MICLQCRKSASENGEVFNGVKIRECVDGHRTGQATAAMIKKSAAYKRAAQKLEKDGIIDFTSDEKAA